MHVIPHVRFQRQKKKKCTASNRLTDECGGDCEYVQRVKSTSNCVEERGETKVV